MTEKNRQWFNLGISLIILFAIGFGTGAFVYHYTESPLFTFVVEVVVLIIASVIVVRSYIPRSVAVVTPDKPLSFPDGQVKGHPRLPKGMAIIYFGASNPPTITPYKDGICLDFGNDGFVIAGHSLQEIRISGNLTVKISSRFGGIIEVG